MASESIEDASIRKGRLQGALGLLTLGVLAYAVAALLTGASPNESVECASAAPTCKIPIRVSPYTGGLFWHCKVEVTTEVTVPATKYTSIEWTITSPGYTFVTGGHAVSILNNPADFSAGSSSASSITLNRIAQTTAVYNYTLSLQSSSGEFCMVPTLPRIKNT